ncbi:hypothetical protein CBR_g54080 [Chara braunii]|uniref:Uncharacterized protein n=1 Tax=Chara braunii TaxID=69332 RepID=A0A388MBV2_CHABU|nr:hypothetical protein CBR_g54080 [Chara braunii]|eukprot:GBG91985.1 hypothetical protein CBR_g54080 [Chara braunii]
MANLYRGLPLLLLVVVVGFHICFLERIPRRRPTCRMSKKVRKMENLMTKSTLSVGAMRSSRQRCSGVEGGKRPYNPTLYSHLPSHKIPLPLSDTDADELQSSTVPQGSGSTKDWMGSRLYQQPKMPMYTELPEGRTPTGYDAGLVDLSFGLRSGSGPAMTHTVVVNPTASDNHTQSLMRAGGVPDNSGVCSRELAAERGVISPKHGGGSTPGMAASRTKTAGVAACRSTTPNEAINGQRDNDDCSATEVMGRQVWDDHRPEIQQASTFSITRRVANMNVGGDDIFVDCDGAGGDYYAAEDGNRQDEDDDGETDLSAREEERRVPRQKEGCATARRETRQEGCGGYDRGRRSEK